MNADVEQMLLKPPAPIQIRCAGAGKHGKDVAQDLERGLDGRHMAGGGDLSQDQLGSSADSPSCNIPSTRVKHPGEAGVHRNAACQRRRGSNEAERGRFPGSPRIFLTPPTAAPPPQTGTLSPPPFPCSSLTVLPASCSSWKADFGCGVSNFTRLEKIFQWRRGSWVGVGGWG